MDQSQEIIQRLFARTAQGIKLGLDRMEKAALRLGNPQNAYKSFHVAGTNGKGSACAYIESVLRHKGFKTGLFTSPHIIDFEERFAVNGSPIPTRQWVEVYNDIAPLIEELSLTFFEATTLLAFELFRREKVDYAVFETGMGGRLDATNILTPVASSITSISIDHREFLGNDVLAISSEKLGIVKQQVPCVMVFPKSAAVRDKAESVCAEKNSRLVFARAESEVEHIEETQHGLAFTYKGRKFSTPLRGIHQVENALVAIKTLEAGGMTDLHDIVTGIAKTFLPGRFHIETIRGKTVVFDVGHNPDAAAIFTNALSTRFTNSPICLVVGIMKDKDGAAMFEQYCRRAQRIILTQPATERSADIEMLKELIPAWYTGKIEWEKQVNEAMEKALSTSEPVVGCVGSFFTVGEAMKELGIRPYN